jgi:hypothetical protein
MDEEWRIVVGFPDYEVSSLGRVRRLSPRVTHKYRSTEIKPTIKGGYLGLSLIAPRAPGERHKVASASVHRLVCQAFHGPKPHPKAHAAHNNGIKTDNRAVNLRWAMPIENERDKRAHGTVALGRRQPQAKLTDELVAELRERHRRGENFSALASYAGVNSGTVWRAIKGHKWAHVKTPHA